MPEPKKMNVCWPDDNPELAVKILDQYLNPQPYTKEGKAQPKAVKKDKKVIQQDE